jgi:hypothetical protein
LLFFDGIPGKGQAVAEAGEDKSRNLAVNRLIESDLALFKGKHDVAKAEFNAVGRRNRVDMLRVKAQSVEGGQNVAGTGLSGPRRQNRNEKYGEQSEADAHESSVVKFGMTGQGEVAVVSAQA